jgi:hypothetical protein
MSFIGLMRQGVAFRDTPYCKEQLTLIMHVDTAPPNIKLSAERTVDILEKTAFSHRCVMLADRPTFRSSTQPP